MPVGCIEQASLRHRRAMVLAFPRAVLAVLARIKRTAGHTTNTQESPDNDKSTDTEDQNNRNNSAEDTTQHQRNDGLATAMICKVCIGSSLPSVSAFSRELNAHVALKEVKLLLRLSSKRVS